MEIESQKSKLYLSNHGRPYLYIFKSNMLRGKDIVGYYVPSKRPINNILVVFQLQIHIHVPYLAQNNKSSLTILETQDHTTHEIDK